MYKQDIAHTLQKEIATIDETIVKLHGLCVEMVDFHQQRTIDETIQNLVAHKNNLEKIIEQINEDARTTSYTRPYEFGL